MSVRPIAGRGRIDLPAATARLIEETSSARPTVLASFGSPYLLSQLTAYAGAYLLAWNAVAANERAVANALAAGARISGKSPISLGDRFPRGTGIAFPRR